MKPKGTVIGSPAVPAEPAPKLEEGESDFGNDEYNPCPGVGREQTEEKELPQALKELMDTTLEEQAARVASYLFEDFSGNFIVTRALLVLCFARRPLQSFSIEGSTLVESSRTPATIPIKVTKFLSLSWRFWLLLWRRGPCLGRYRAFCCLTRLGRLNQFLGS